jgi:CHAT domain-containing protein
MRSFYDRLEEDGPAAALRAAQRDIMKDFPHLFAWAGFGLTGMPR